MKTFKVGDKVRITANRSSHGHKIGDIVEVARLGENCMKPAIITKEGWYCWHSEIELLNDWQQGDILVHEDGGERKILGVCGEVYFVSRENDFDVSRGCAFTKKRIGRSRLGTQNP